MAGVAAASPTFALAGVVGRGSERSRACADFCGVPLYDDVDALPGDVACACVVVGSRVTGGSGGDLAVRLLARGISVLQEHPLHHDELAACLRAARAGGARYRLNTHYVTIDPVRSFLAAARALGRRSTPTFVEAHCGVQVLFTLLDIVGRVGTGLRPYAIEPIPRSGAGSRGGPFTTLHLRVGGLPVTLHVQNTLDPDDPDNHAHHHHRISFGTDAGLLTLVGTYGPLVWSPRTHLPDGAKGTAEIHRVPDEAFDDRSAVLLEADPCPSWRDIVRAVWPAGVGRALEGLRRDIAGETDMMRAGQYYLTLSQIWAEVTGALGYPSAISGVPPVRIDPAWLRPSSADLEAATW